MYEETDDSPKSSKSPLPAANSSTCIKSEFVEKVLINVNEQGQCSRINIRAFDDQTDEYDMEPDIKSDSEASLQPLKSSQVSKEERSSLWFKLPKLYGLLKKSKRSSENIQATSTIAQIDNSREEPNETPTEMISKNIRAVQFFSLVFLLIALTFTINSIIWVTSIRKISQKSLAAKFDDAQVFVRNFALDENLHLKVSDARFYDKPTRFNWVLNSLEVSPVSIVDQEGRRLALKDGLPGMQNLFSMVSKIPQDAASFAQAAFASINTSSQNDSHSARENTDFLQNTKQIIFAIENVSGKTGKFWLPVRAAAEGTFAITFSESMLKSLGEGSPFSVDLKLNTQIRTMGVICSDVFINQKFEFVKDGVLKESEPKKSKASRKSTTASVKRVHFDDLKGILRNIKAEFVSLRGNSLVYSVKLDEISKSDAKKNSMSDFVIPLHLPSFSFSVSAAYPWNVAEKPQKLMQVTTSAIDLSMKMSSTQISVLKFNNDSMADVHFEFAKFETIFHSFAFDFPKKDYILDFQCAEEAPSIASFLLTYLLNRRYGRYNIVEWLHDSPAPKFCYSFLPAFNESSLAVKLLVDLPSVAAASDDKISIVNPGPLDVVLASDGRSVGRFKAKIPSFYFSLDSKSKKAKSQRLEFLFSIDVHCEMNSWQMTDFFSNLLSLLNGSADKKYGVFVTVASERNAYEISSRQLSLLVQKMKTQWFHFPVDHTGQPFEYSKSVFVDFEVDGSRSNADVVHVMSPLVSTRPTRFDGRSWNFGSAYGSRGKSFDFNLAIDVYYRNVFVKALRRFMFVLLKIFYGRIPRHVDFEINWKNFTTHLKQTAATINASKIAAVLTGNGLNIGLFEASPKNAVDRVRFDLARQPTAQTSFRFHFKGSFTFLPEFERFLRLFSWINLAPDFQPYADLFCNFNKFSNDQKLFVGSVFFQLNTVRKLQNNLISSLLFAYIGAVETPSLDSMLLPYNTPSPHADAYSPSSSMNLAFVEQDALGVQFKLRVPFRLEYLRIRFAHGICIKLFESANCSFDARPLPNAIVHIESSDFGRIKSHISETISNGNRNVYMWINASVVIFKEEIGETLTTDELVSVPGNRQKRIRKCKTLLEMAPSTQSLARFLASLFLNIDFTGFLELGFLKQNHFNSCIMQHRLRNLATDASNCFSRIAFPLHLRRPKNIDPIDAINGFISEPDTVVDYFGPYVGLKFFLFRPRKLVGLDVKIENIRLILDAFRSSLHLKYTKILDFHTSKPSEYFSEFAFDKQIIEMDDIHGKITYDQAYNVTNSTSKCTLAENSSVFLSLKSILSEGASEIILPIDLLRREPIYNLASDFALDDQKLFDFSYREISVEKLPRTLFISEPNFAFVDLSSSFIVKITFSFEKELQEIFIPTIFCNEEEEFLRFEFEVKLKLNFLFALFGKEYECMNVFEKKIPNIRHEIIFQFIPSIETFKIFYSRDSSDVAYVTEVGLMNFFPFLRENRKNLTKLTWKFDEKNTNETEIFFGYEMPTISKTLLYWDQRLLSLVDTRSAFIVKVVLRNKLGIPIILPYDILKKIISRITIKQRYTMFLRSINEFGIEQDGDLQYLKLKITPLSKGPYDIWIESVLLAENWSYPIFVAC